MEGSELLVIAGQRAFALQDLDFDARLVVGVSGKRLRLLGRDRRVAGDHRRRHGTGGFDRQRQRSHVEQEDVLNVALDHAALNGRADGDDFIRIHTLVGLLVDQLAGHFNDAGHAGHAADEHEFIDVRGCDLGIVETGCHRLHRALGESVGELFELGAGQILADVLRTGLVRRDERQIDFVGLGGGKGDLGLFGFFLETLNRVRLSLEVDAGFGFEFGQEPIHDRVVPVIAAEVGVAVGRFDFEHAVADFEHGDIERAAAQVINRDLLVGLLVEAVSERGRRRLVHDAEHFETRDATGVLGGMALAVVKVSRNGDDRLGDFLAELGFGVGLELGQNEGGNFLRGIGLLLAIDGDFNRGVAVLGLHDLVRHAGMFVLGFRVLAAHEALDGEDGVLRVRDCLAFRRLAHEPLAGFGKRDNGRSRPRALGIFENHRLAIFHDCHTGVRCTQIDA